ncbi:MAG: PAS domain S-box protein [Bacteroidales bacterium]|nr:PAS domain S-box protein [Bacteroidales bacterium]
MNYQDKNKEELINELQELQQKYNILKEAYDTDINELKQTEEALRESEQMFRLLITNIRDVVYSVDVETKEFNYLSPTFERITGYSLKDIREMGGRQAFLAKVVTEEKVTEWDNILMQLSEFHSDTDFTHETWWLCKDGSYRCLQDHWIPIYINGKLVSTDGVLIDITERKQFEEKIKESEKRYRILFETSPTGIMLLDENGVILETNDVFSKITLYTQEELIGSNVRMLVPSDLDNNAEESIKRILAGETLEQEIRNRRKDGTFCYLSLREKAIILPNGQRGILSVSNDITESKHAEEALQKSEEMFRLLITNIRDVVYSVDVETKEFNYLSPTFERITGYSLKDIKEMGGRQAFLAKVVTEEKFKEWDGFLSYLTEFKLDTDFKNETWWLCKDGTYKCLQDRWTPIYINGKLVSTDGVLIDITEHKHFEEKLKESELRYRTLFETSPTGITLLDENGIILEANDIISKITLYTQEELIGSNVRMFVPPDLDHDAIVSIKKILAGETLEQEVLNRKKDGTICNLLLREKSILLPNGQRGILSVYNDITERKRAEEALLKSEERFKQLAEIFPEVIFECNIQGKVTYTNEKGYKKLGYLEDDLAKGINIINLIVPEDRKRVMAQLQKRIEKTTNEYTEFKPLCRDGSSFHAIAFSAPIIQNHEVVGIRGFMLDITERKQFEEKIKESEQRYRTLFETSPTGIILLDENGIILEANDIITKHTLYSQEELVGSDVRIFVSPDDSYVVDENIKRILAGETLAKEVVNRRKDGTFCDFSLREKAVMLPNGQRGILSLYNDITERKLVEKKLQESEEQFKNLAELIPQPIWETDLDANFTYTNHAGRDLFGYNQKDLEKGLNILALIASEDRQRILENFFGKLEGKQFEDHEYTGLKKDGTKFPILVYSSTIQRNGKQAGIRGILVDITELKQAETEIKLINEELSKINAEKDKFFSIIAHDLKSHFNAIVSFSQILARQVIERNFDEIEDYSKIIVQSSHNAMELLKNLMEWSQSQTGRMNFNPERFDMNDLINEITFFFNDVSGQKSITITKNVNTTEPVYADKAMISTILRNLISNALKFTPQKGKVTISAKQVEKSMIEVSVKDTGIGMNPEMIENLFRLDVNTSRLRTDGEFSTGLGLHLCDEFVEKHGGTIFVTSEEGKGSEFKFTLPMSSWSNTIKLPNTNQILKHQQTI